MPVNFTSEITKTNLTFAKATVNKQRINNNLKQQVMNLLNNEQKMLDIIFAKRNRSYGAYAIRSAYGSTIFRSLFIVAITVLSSAGLAYWLKENPMGKELVGQILDQDSIYVIPFKAEEPKQDDPTPQAKKETGGATSTAQTYTLINETTLDTTKQVVNNEIVPVNTNTAGTTGTETGTNTLVNTNTTTTTGGGNPDPHDIGGVDEWPEFEGGHNALLAFVKSRLVYPESAVTVGKQGTLYAKFVVDETGNISKIFLQNNLGFGLDDEAMRVLKMIPKFKSPGKVKGQPVKTYYQIPIKFKLG